MDALLATQVDGTENSWENIITELRQERNLQVCSYMSWFFDHQSNFFETYEWSKYICKLESKKELEW